VEHSVHRCQRERGDGGWREGRFLVDLTRAKWVAIDSRKKEVEAGFLLLDKRQASVKLVAV
jgi:hypothetical protein